MALPAQDERTVPAAVLGDLAREPLERTLDGIRTLLDQHPHLIVVYSRALPAGAERRLHTVRSLLESDRIALYRSDLPPLGVAVLARQLRQLASCDLGPGVLASAARLLTHYVHCGAVLNSVTRLDRVPVDLKAHARSWVPGSQFGVLAHPQPQLVRVGPEAVLAGPDFATWMLVAKGQLQSDWIGGHLAPAWRTLGLREAALPAESATWWGTRKLIEFCGYLPDLSVLYQLVASVRQSVCHWCGIDVIGDRCVFCSAAPPDPGERPDGQGEYGASDAYGASGTYGAYGASGTSGAHGASGTQGAPGAYEAHEPYRTRESRAPAG
ncbi:hypothetical protein [Streptomyces sp. NPDC004042]|uniref:hypothetical protein n=1 Tax=Streptomyces sp. NPDC004042 TaxID=3154451 RepID=UPI0033ADC113